MKSATEIPLLHDAVCDATSEILQTQLKACGSSIGVTEMHEIIEKYLIPAVENMEDSISDRYNPRYDTNYRG